MKISVLREAGMPARHLAVRPEALFEQAQGVELRFQSVNDILGRGVDGDVFFNAHGEVYPIEIEDRLYAFLAGGGGLLHMGGAPFETALKRQDGGWVEVVRTLGDSRDHKGYGPLDAEFDVFRAKLGFTPYQLAYPAADLSDLRICFDPALIGCEDVCKGVHDKSVNLATTIQMRLLQPYLDLNDHRAYMGREIVRDAIFAGKLVAPSGVVLAHALQLIKAWGNPYLKDQSHPLKPWVLYTARVESMPQQALIDTMLNWLNTPVFLKSAELSLATVHPGEFCRVDAVLTGALPEGWRLLTKAAPMSREAFREHKAPTYEELPCEGGANVTYAPDALVTAVRFELLDQAGVLRDYLETGVAMWNPALLAQATRASANGSYFDVHSEHGDINSGWVSGTNWQDRNLFGLSFHNPNPLRIARDAVEMAQTGMVFVRPHYFMPGWFRTVPGKVYEEISNVFYQTFEEGPLLSERHLRALEAHVMLFCSMGLVFMPSVYTNIGRCMGSPSHWLGTGRLFVIREHIENQKQFARQLMQRFGNIPAISWDLINEPDTSMDHAGQWLTEHREIWGKTGHMVSIGAISRHDNLLLGEAADWHSHHGKTVDFYRTGKPYLLHEAHYPVPGSYAGEDELEQYFNECFAHTLRDGGCSVMPWNWNMSFMNWRYRGGWVDFWDLHLGICVHADGTPRRGKSLMRNWDTILRKVSFDQEANRQVVYVYPKTTICGRGSFEYMDLLNRKNIPFVGVNDRDFAKLDLRQTQLVIFPLYGVGYRDETWSKAIEFTRSGGTIWAHNENMAMNEMGVTVPQRAVPEMGCRQAMGKGRIEWCLGWNIDRDLGNEFPDMIVLESVLDSLELYHRPKDALALRGGSMEFTQKWTCGRHAMLYDWRSNEPWPDANVVSRVQIKDEQGRVSDAWTNGEQPVSVDGLTFSPTAHMFFKRAQRGVYYATAEEMLITGGFDPLKIKLTLVSNYTDNGSWIEHPELVRTAPAPDGIKLSQSGWQRMCWVRIEI